MKYLVTNIESFQSAGKEPTVPKEVVDFVKANKKDVFVVLDESSKIKSNKASRESGKSKRTQAVLKLNTIGHRAILTGTFISKTPVNAWDQLEFLRKKYFEESMFSFENRYSIMVEIPGKRGIKGLISEDMWHKLRKQLKNSYAAGEYVFDGLVSAYAKRFGLTREDCMHIIKHEKYTPFRRLKELYERIKDDVMIVKKKDVLDLPPKVHTRIAVTATPEMTKLYKDLVNLAYIDAADGATTQGISLYHRFQDVCNGYIPLEEEDEEGNKKITLTRQKSNPKIETLIEMLEEIDMKQHKVVVWSNRKLFLNDIYEAVTEAGYTACKYDGDTKPLEKKDIESRFRAGEIQVFIGNQGSGAYGLDWIKEADYMFFMSNDYSVEKREQAEDRIHRGGITSSKAIYDIVVAGTVDDKVSASLKLGKELIHSGVTDCSIFDLQNAIAERHSVHKVQKIAAYRSNWVHQDAAVERFKDKEACGLLFDCGTGKTRTAIKLAEAKGKAVLVIAPKNLCWQWEEAIEENASIESEVLVAVAETKKKKDFPLTFQKFLDNL